MFEHLADYSKILVSGPQRSGTTICAKMIAHDTGHKYVDEDEFGIHFIRPVVNYLSNRENVVVQCPGLMWGLHMLSGKDVAVVIMRRNIVDIARSEQRIKWGGEELERRKYKNTHGPISTLKYEFFDNHQRHLIQNVYDVEYESLSEHEMWIPRHKRVNFDARQTA